MGKQDIELELEIAMAQLGFLKTLALDRLLSPEETKLYDVCSKYVTLHRKNSAPKDIPADYKKEPIENLLDVVSVPKLPETTGSSKPNDEK